MSCAQADCDGTLVDGYCDTCGLAPLPATQTSRPAAARSGETHWLGRGLVPVAQPAPHDPSRSLTRGFVAEHDRFCSGCHERVGRARAGAPGRAEGHCVNCGRFFSFTPKLRPGILVEGAYEVAGCLAHGGQGWIYLARDLNLKRRVVLKGLLNTGDEAAGEALRAELLRLVEAKHANIVQILTVAERAGSRYIVMEHLDGESLQDKLKRGRLPVEEAIAYVYEILPALEHLHAMGLLFCDFKPDNIMHVRGRDARDCVKLIDLGGVYRVEDSSTVWYWTPGFQAPEVKRHGPSIASDLYSVARTLAALCVKLDASGALPGPTTAPFDRHDSFYRFLGKGTAADPDDRFQSAAEMREQLFGVLREVVAQQNGRTVASASAHFVRARGSRPEQRDWRLLPTLPPPPDDVAHEPVEVQLRLVQTLIDVGSYAEASVELDAVEAADAREWRVAWLRGVAALAQQQPAAAGEHFASVYRALPGELSPKFAQALAAECAADTTGAAAWYETVSRTDPSSVTAAFRLALCRLAAGDRAAAAEAFDRIEDDSSAYADAQLAMIDDLLGHGRNALPMRDDLQQASLAIDKLPQPLRAQVRADLLESARELLERDPGAASTDVTVVGHAFTDDAIRRALGQAYRAQARTAATVEERIRLIDKANRVRPRTWT